MTGYSNACLLLLCFLALLTFNVTANAESPVIAEQQREYGVNKKTWEHKRVPKHLNGAEAFDALEQPSSPRTSGTPRTVMLLKNTNFEFSDGIGFWIEELVITMEPKVRGTPVNFDKVDSFTIRLHSGEIVMRSNALTQLFNKHILDYPGRSLKDLKLKTEDNRLIVDGTLLTAENKGIPTSLGGDISLTKDNKLLFSVDKIEGLGIPVTDTLKLLGFTLPQLVNINRPGIALRDYGIEMDHRKMFPLPELTGDIKSVNLKEDGVHLVFADAPNVSMSPPEFLKDSFIWIQSGDVKLYGAVILNAQIALLPFQETKSLNFDLYDYRKQLSTSIARLYQNGMLVIQLPQTTKQ